MDSIFTRRKVRLDIINSLRPKKVNKKANANLPKGLFVKCPECLNGFPKNMMEESFYICPKCSYHLKIGAYTRFEMLFDEQYKEIFKKSVKINPISFPGYEKKLDDQTKKSGLSEAAVSAVGEISGKKSVVIVLDSSFLMGSMGCAVGEKITKTIEYAQKYKLPLVIFSASGGARMQEGIFSLMQMAKTSAALKRFSDSGGFYLSYLTHPTTGGVTASFASLGDIILAEPGALIGFAGPRVIEQTIRQVLPKGFQRSEFVLEHGFLDAIVDRKNMKDTISKLIGFHSKKKVV